MEVTQWCPFNCVHCSSDADPGKTTELERELVHQLIAESEKLGVSEIVFSGGEPLAWPHILEAISHASELGIATCIYTTGTIPLAPRNHENFPEKLKLAGLNHAVFSVYGGERTYENVTRVVGSYRQVLAKIEDFRGNGISVQLHFVPFRNNFRELPDIMSLANELQISKLSILRFVPHGRGALAGKSIALSTIENLELRGLIKRIRQGNDSIQVRLGSPYNFLLMEKDVLCKAGIDRLIIGPDGLVYACDAFKNYRTNSGKHDSVYRKSLAEIWETSYLCMETRKYLSSGPPLR